jgi:hypothetical protein
VMGSPGYTFEVRPFHHTPFHKNWGVFSYPTNLSDGRFDIVFNTEDRAIAACELIERWYEKGRFDGERDYKRSIDDRR